MSQAPYSSLEREIDFGIARAQEVRCHRRPGAVGDPAGCLGADGLDGCVAQAPPAGTGAVCPVVLVPARAAERLLAQISVENRESSNGETMTQFSHFPIKVKLDS